MKARERLWLNQDRTKVVEEGHKDARTLLAGVGQDIPKEHEGLVKDMGKSANKEIKSQDDKELGKSDPSENDKADDQKDDKK